MFDNVINEINNRHDKFKGEYRYARNAVVDKGVKIIQSNRKNYVEITTLDLLEGDDLSFYDDSIPLPEVPYTRTVIKFHPIGWSTKVDIPDEYSWIGSQLHDSQFGDTTFKWENNNGNLLMCPARTIRWLGYRYRNYVSFPHFINRYGNKIIPIRIMRKFLWQNLKSILTVRAAAYVAYDSVNNTAYINNKADPKMAYIAIKHLIDHPEICDS